MRKTVELSGEQQEQLSALVGDYARSLARAGLSNDDALQALTAMLRQNLLRKVPGVDAFAVGWFAACVLAEQLGSLGINPPAVATLQAPPPAPAPPIGQVNIELTSNDVHEVVFAGLKRKGRIPEDARGTLSYSVDPSKPARERLVMKLHLEM